MTDKALKTEPAPKGGGADEPDARRFQLNSDDPRQVWVCVAPEGPRTGHEPFRSDAHKPPKNEVVACPTCGSTSVRFLTAGLDPEASGFAAAAPAPVTT